MTNSWRHHIRAVAGLLLVLAATGRVFAACSVSSSGLAFGAYQPLTFAGKLTSTAVNSVATVSVNCDAVSGNPGYTLKLGPSPEGNSTNPRYMVNAAGGSNMAFNIYTDPTYSTVWGDGSIGSIITHGLLNGSFNHTVYGRIPAGQNALKAGSFTSLLTITITYNL